MVERSVGTKANCVTERDIASCLCYIAAWFAVFVVYTCAAAPLMLRETAVNNILYRLSDTKCGCICEVFV